MKKKKLKSFHIWCSCGAEIEIHDIDTHDEDISNYCTKCGKEVFYINNANPHIEDSLNMPDTTFLNALFSVHY